MMAACSKGKISNFKVQEQLFNSLCRSVLLYAVVMWGCKKMEEIISFQFYFLRKLFYLQNEVSRWKILLETNARPIENSFLNVLSKFLNRLRSKRKDSLIFGCYEMLIKYQSKMNPKRSWTCMVNKVLEEWKVPILNLNLSHIATACQIKKIVASHRLQAINHLVETMCSRQNDVYSKLKAKIGSEKYLNSNLNFSAKKLIFQIRINLNYVTHAGKSCKLNGSRSGNYSICDIFNLQDNEDVYHVMYKCPHYSGGRFLFHRDIYRKTVNRDNYLLSIDWSNEKILSNIYKFWSYAMKVRNFLSTY